MGRSEKARLEVGGFFLFFLSMGLLVLTLLLNEISVSIYK